MAPAYKLTYFDVTALGEPIRFLLSYGGIEFEDIRISHESWPALKSSTPFGQLPLLEHNGKVAYQSIAISRYVAKQVKLVGKDDWEDLEIDATVDTITDLRIKLAQYSFETDEKAKKEKEKSILNESLPFYLEKLDAQAKKNNGYFVGGHLTWVDLLFTASLDFINFMAKKDIIANSPNLQKVKQNVVKIPNIKAWLEKRPKDTLQ
ncbi:glutathione S-transferase-like isoform X1 [Anoplophora glabripennis]|uniref:glutathione S-transferase-like isoform X1 n=1 Tax=Anoplophora glabripennis TaxID=217634 RepID=UPI0008756B61|nr:glutathione S-transferase-like isoform X1 [Anoplophora glabripennis]XP_018560994.1 glutathione S-transferase-like isoform X1 [Anoplophora glabripennis]